MLDWTDRHCRYFHRRMSRHAVLYTEMVTTGAILYGRDPERFLGHAGDEPVILQLGGGDPDALARCAELGQQWGYAAINLNVGCPSDRVQNNMIGACLMAHPALVAEGVRAMKRAVDIPVTVKTRIGIDDMDSFEQFEAFCAAQINAGVDELVIHARKAWLQGLSPKENREIPPLKYDWVHALKQKYPQTPIILNGGLTDLGAAARHLAKMGETPSESGKMAENRQESAFFGVADGRPEAHPVKMGETPLDGVMLGRAVYENPWLLADVDPLFYDQPAPVRDRFQVVEQMLPYIQAHLDAGGRLNHVTRHMLGLFKGQPGGRRWRQHLSQHAHRPDAGVVVVEAALDMVREAHAAREARDRAVS